MPNALITFELYKLSNFINFPTHFLSLEQFSIMYYLVRKETDPYFNLAAEEYLLKHGPGEIFMLWQNDPCVVIGKHQNAFAEINIPFAMEHNIPVIRRISGGGAVYHDKGNVNFTFIAEAEKGKQVDFHRFLKPLAAMLQGLGLNVQIGKRNDLLLDGKKFSGNAEHVFKNRVIHHGTLLFDTDLDILNTILEGPANKFSGKALPSVRSVVTNIKSEIKTADNINNFIDKLINQYLIINPDCIEYQLTETDFFNIERLAEERYRTDKWNYGYSPDFVLDIHFNESQYKFKITSGSISEILLSGYNKSKGNGNFETFKLLINVPFTYLNIRNFIHDYKKELCITETEAESFLLNFFI